MTAAAIVTLCDYSDTSLCHAVFTNRDTARRGPVHLEYRTDLKKCALPPSWGKVYMLRDALEFYDLAIWVDADAVIWTPLTYDALDAALDGHSMAFAHDENGINAGVWIIRHEAAPFLDEVLALAPKYANHRWWEQGAIHELAPDHAELDPDVWNCKPDKFAGRGICHFAGIENRWPAVKAMYAAANEVLKS